MNVHIDLATLADTRDTTDLHDLVFRGEGWNLTRSAAEQLLCDTALTATLFAGRNRVLDTNDRTERFSVRQRRAIAARDAHCVFPGCGRLPRHCDIHHVDHLEHDGLTVTHNGVLLCRFHHRLLHHGWTLHHHDHGWTATDPHNTTWPATNPTAADPTAADPGAAGTAVETSGSHSRRRPGHQSAA